MAESRSNAKHPEKDTEAATLRGPRIVASRLLWLSFAAASSCAPDGVAPVRSADVPSPDLTAERARKSAAEDLGPEVQYVVLLGDMRSAAAGGEGVRVILRDRARARAATLAQAAVVDADGPLARKAAERRLPVIVLDGVVTLTESRDAAGLRVRASVEFAVRRDQSLKAILSGAATAVGTSPTISERGRRVLEEGAIDGAVQVALASAKDGLMVAAR